MNTPKPGVQGPDAIESARTGPAGKSMNIKQDLDIEVRRCLQDLFHRRDWSANPLVCWHFQTSRVEGRVILKGVLDSLRKSPHF